jgi:hypothetical protein
MSLMRNTSMQLKLSLEVIVATAADCWKVTAQQLNIQTA